MADMETIGRFLDGLDADARARVITEPMEKVGFKRITGDHKPAGCLIQVALGARNEREWEAMFWKHLPWLVAYRYDDLVDRFGQAEANRMVRERAIAGGGAPVENRPAHQLETAVGVGEDRPAL